MAKTNTTLEPDGANKKQKNEYVEQLLLYLKLLIRKKEIP
jgi:hypothetical protein